MGQIIQETHQEMR